jgi:hypothetical protein
MTSSHQSHVDMAPRSLSHVWNSCYQELQYHGISHTSVLSPPHAHLKPHMKQESGAGASKYIYLHIHMRIYIAARSRTARSARGQHMIVLPNSARYRLAYVHHAGWAQCHAWREARSAGLTHGCFGDLLLHCTGFPTSLMIHPTPA